MNNIEEKKIISETEDLQKVCDELYGKVEGLLEYVKLCEDYIDRKEVGKCLCDVELNQLWIQRKLIDVEYNR